MSNEIERIKIAESQTETDLTPNQRESGDYKKGEVNLKGFDIVIENPKGSFRSGVDDNGKSWQCEIKHTYGYFKDTIGKDGDEVDVFIGDYLDQDFKVYIVSQIKSESKEFDEHKVMFGFEDMEDAIDGYFDNYCEKWDGFDSITELSIDDFDKWLAFRKLISSNVLNQNFKMISIEDFGENRTKIIQLEGEVVENQTLEDLQKQAGSEKDFDTLIVEIASNGGSVLEGIKIMMWFDSVSALNKKVITVVTANAYSIASLIMLSANKRYISKTADVMVHNPMLPEIKYANAEALEAHAKDLRNLEGIMYELYQIFTGLSMETIKELMDNETYLNADEAKKYGFVDEIADLKQRPKSLVVNTQKITNMKSLTNKLNIMMSSLTGSNVVNQSYYDDKGGSLEIYQEDPATYKVGDKTNVKSVSVTLADGSVLTIDENGSITEIDRSKIVADETKEDPSKIDPNKLPAEGTEGGEGFNKGSAPNEDLLTEDARARAKAKMEADKVEADTKAKAQADEEEKILAQAKEIEAKRGASSELPKEDPKEAPKAEEGAPAQLPAQAPSTETDEQYVSMEDFVTLMEVVKELKSKVDVLESSNATTAKAIEETKEFNEKATEAITTLAQNTSSAFKAEAKVPAFTPVKEGSIFGQFVKKG